MMINHSTFDYHVSYEQNTICPYLGIRTNMIDLGPEIGQMSIFLNEINFIWKVRLNYTFSMNISSIPT